MKNGTFTIGEKRRSVDMFRAILPTPRRSRMNFPIATVGLKPSLFHALLWAEGWPRKRAAKKIDFHKRKSTFGESD